MPPVRFHGFRGYFHIVEHALHPLSKLSSTLNLKLSEHTALSIVGYGAIEQETLR